MSNATPPPASSAPSTADSGLWQRVGLWLGPALLLLFFLSPAPEGLSPAAWHTAGVAVLMATWWITEALPIAATALVPLVAFPLLDAGTIQETSSPYAAPIIFLFLGGFLIALALQRWGLHRRLALRIISRVGTGPNEIVGGFMLAAALLSMWVSNTATALMLLPVALSIVDLAERSSDAATARRFGVALLLALAYGCNIGGMGTLVGTPPNALMAGFLEQEYGFTVSFVAWLGVGLPIVAVGLPLTFFVLTRLTFPLKIKHLPGAAETVAAELTELGPLSKPERWVAAVFVLTALLWITRPLLQPYVPGLSDAGIAMLGGLLLFVIPVDLRRGIFLLDWPTARTLPWGTLILFGGGLSLAGAFTRTGLSQWIGEALGALGFLPLVAIILLVVTVVIFLTELTSNAATTATMLPVIAAMALALGHHPMQLAAPTVLAASCAFMLPVATPPNAIVYGSDRITIPQMARAGLWLNLAFIVIITAAAYALVEAAFTLP